MDERIIPNGTLVQIKKPTTDCDQWEHEWKRIDWIPLMDQYHNKIDIIKRDRMDNSYRLRDIPYNWHRDWLIILSKINCFWCQKRLKVAKERCDGGTLTFKYCPKCGR